MLMQHMLLLEKQTKPSSTFSLIVNFDNQHFVDTPSGILFAILLELHYTPGYNFQSVFTKTALFIYVSTALYGRHKFTAGILTRYLNSI